VDARPLVSLVPWTAADEISNLRFVCTASVVWLNPSSDHMWPQRFGYRLDDVAWDARGSWRPLPMSPADGR